jgi:ketosteroid isomerase-like protein
MSAEAEIGQLLDDWAAAVRAHDLAGAVRGRSAGIVMFDVPEPLQAKGMNAYRDTWTQYFRDRARAGLRCTRPISSPKATWPGFTRSFCVRRTKRQRDG